VRSAEQSEKAEQGLGDAGAKREKLNAGWSSPVARQAHNLKVVGSNPTPATIASSAAWPESRVADLAHRKQPFLIPPAYFVGPGRVLLRCESVKIIRRGKKPLSNV
jgi:hypothetical protein